MLGAAEGVGDAMPASPDEAVLRYNKIYGLKRPLKRQLAELNTWMERPTMGNVFLEGSDRLTWNKPDRDDLMTLQPPSREDGFTSDLTLALVGYYHRLIGRYIHVRSLHLRTMH